MRALTSVSILECTMVNEQRLLLEGAGMRINLRLDFEDGRLGTNRKSPIPETIT